MVGYEMSKCKEKVELPIYLSNKSNQISIDFNKRMIAMDSNGNINRAI